MAETSQNQTGDLLEQVAARLNNMLIGFDKRDCVALAREAMRAVADWTDETMPFGVIDGDLLRAESRR